MNDKEFDKMIKKNMQEDKQIPDNINQLFSEFGMEVKMKEQEKNKKIRNINCIKMVPIAASLMIVTFFGGCTFAHVNGRETIISPLLRQIGINSKYEDNRTEFNEEIKKEGINIKILDGAIDDTSLIIGYEIQIDNNDYDNWIEIEGEYKINNISVKPINHSIDKLSDTSYIYYQVFDASEIKIENKENVKINATIRNIKEYKESETLDSVEAVYGKEHKNIWNFEENIAVNNIEKSKIYELEDSSNQKTIENVKLSVTEYMTGSYTNILKIKTDKSNYEGDDFKKYYKVLDENNKEICMCLEEDRQYDERVYTDRLILGNINENSKIKVEVYLKMSYDKSFKKASTILVDLSKKIEKKEFVTNLKEYISKEYRLKYKDTWTLTEKLDTTKVGPNSRYLGALSLEIPSTTNSNYTSSLYVKVENTDKELDEYVDNRIEQNKKEYIEKKSINTVNFKNLTGYEIISETTDGDEIYTYVDFVTKANRKIYNITFFGSEKEYNNIKRDIKDFIGNFEIINK